MIYTRVSQDTSGFARSVTEQEKECRAVCQRNGWPVDRVVTDNDIGASRWSQKKRPGYQSLPGILRPGHVLVAWESSRATRIPRETEDLIDLCMERGAVLCYSGAVLDPEVPADRLMLRVTGAMGAHEADLTRNRVLRDVRARVAEGKPHGRMPYGYSRVVTDMTTGRTEWKPDPVQAPIVREIVDRVLAGASLFVIARDLDARGVTPPSRGGDHPPAESWMPRRMRTMLLSPTYAGLRTHRGVVTGKGSWEPIITETEHQRLAAILTNPARKTHHSGSTPVHLLSGIAVCGVCGKELRWFGPKSVKTPTYQCPDNHVRRRADRLDELVTAAMLAYLSDPRARTALSEGDETTNVGAALAEARELRQRLDSFYDQAADGSLSPAALTRIEAKLLPRIEQAEAAARQAVLDPAIAHVVAASMASGDASVVWEALPLEDQRAAIRSALTVRVDVQPPMGRRFDRRYVKIRWRE